MSFLPYSLSQAHDGIKPSAMSAVMKWLVQKDVVSFAGGMPDPTLFPLEEITQAAETVAARTGHMALHYLPAAGLQDLREFFADDFQKKGIDTSVDGIVPVNGVQQGIHMCSELLLDQGDTIAATVPSYFGALQAFDAWNVEYAQVTLTEQGVDLEELETVFATRKPKFFYVNPSFQNPSGISIPVEQRPYIVALAQKYHVPIIEDDVFGDLYFDAPLPPLKSFDDGEHVLYLTSLSKTVSAGFRVGFVVPPKQLIQKFLNAKEINDVNVNTYAQYIVLELCKNGDYNRILPKLRTVYKERRDAALNALSQHFDSYADWTTPGGGLFTWLYLKDGIRSQDLLEFCSKRGVVFVPGTGFYPAGNGGEDGFRFSYSILTPEKIAAGVELLSKCAEEFISNRLVTA